MTRTLSILCAAALVAGCSGQTTPSAVQQEARPAQQPATIPPPPQPPPPPPDPRKLIDPGVFDPYTKADYPKLAKKLGPAWVRIEPFREAAAMKALESPRCRSVDVAEVSLDRSTREDLFAFVYCNNLNERLDFTESTVLQSGTPLTNSEKTIDRATAIAACSAAAKAEALYPSLAKTHTWAGASFQTYRPLGSARVLLDFEATNALGVALPYRADCLFPVGKPMELVIQPR